MVLVYIEVYYVGEVWKFMVVNEKYVQEVLEVGKGCLVMVLGSSVEVLFLIGVVGLVEDELVEMWQQQVVVMVLL